MSAAARESACEIIKRLDAIESNLNRLDGLVRAIRFMSRASDFTYNMLSMDCFRAAIENISIIQAEFIANVVDDYEAVREHIKQEAVQ